MERLLLAVHRADPGRITGPQVAHSPASVSGNHTVNHAIVLTGAFIATVPLLVVFAVLGKHIVGGITSGAVKS